MADPIPLDPKFYPLTYRASLGTGLNAILAMVGAFETICFARTGAHHPLSPFTSGGWVSICVYIVLGFALLNIINVCFARITLYADRIERKTWFDKKIMYRQDVAGIKVSNSLMYKYTYLISKSDASATFILPEGIKKDTAWEAWMRVAPDLTPPEIAANAIVHWRKIFAVVLVIFVAIIIAMMFFVVLLAGRS